MNTFKGIEYIKIAIANAFGLDKELFEDRITWVDDMIKDGLLTDKDLLDKTTDYAEEPALFTAAVMTLRDALAGIPSGFMVGLDACSSGIQIMGALMGCKTTCESTGLVDPSRRADIYSDVTDVMNTELKQIGIQVSPERSDIKQALMTHFYGSTAEPEAIFGEGTQELICFYDSLDSIAPGATIAMDHLLGAWQPYALEHTWTLPDGFEVVVPVMSEVDFKVEVDELDHSTFTHRIYENQGQKKGLSIAANVIHSIDGMIVREMNRRCNYDQAILRTVLIEIDLYLGTKVDTNSNTEFVSIRLAEQLYASDVKYADVPVDKLFELKRIVNDVLRHKPFPLVCVHDEFKCHANNMNQLRKHYISIFKQLSQSDLLADILAQVHGVQSYKLPKLGKVDHLIEKSNYALS